jgi:hypothetical protein
VTEIRSFDGRHVIAHYWQNDGDGWVEFEGAWPEYFSYAVDTEDVSVTIAGIQDSFDYWQSNLTEETDRKIAELNETREKWA